MRSIRTDFGFNLLCSASKLKRGIFEKIWWVLLVFCICEFFFSQYFCWFFFLPWISWWGHCPWIIFSQIYFTFFMIYASRLFFYEPFFQCDLLCLFFVLFFFCCFFSSQPDVNITWITGHIHHSIVDKIDPTSEYIEMTKKKYLINYIGLHIFVKCDQKNLFTVPSIDQ